MNVQTVGAGYFVRADVATRLALSCDCCLASFEHPVQTSFQVLMTDTHAVIVGEHLSRCQPCSSGGATRCHQAPVLIC